MTDQIEQTLPQSAVDELRQIIDRYPQPRSALLPMLHLVQSVEGCVTPAGIELCADLLDLTPAEVAAVATFYTLYKRRPVGDYHVGVCTNTLCAVMGGDAIFARLKEHLGIGNDETTGDGKVTLEHVECNAACDYAPVMMVNWEFMDNMTPQSAVDVVDRLRSGEEVTSTRGPRICTWREAERVLAGFPDDLADEGPPGGAATMVGLEIARERGWRAPEPERRATAPESVSDTTNREAAGVADTQRADAETEIAESPADAVGGKGDDAGQAEGPTTGGGKGAR
jgi:NADH-quinone oxidoreductase subunit E